MTQGDACAEGTDMSWLVFSFILAYAMHCVIRFIYLMNLLQTHRVVHSAWVLWNKVAISQKVRKFSPDWLFKLNRDLFKDLA